MTESWPTSYVLLYRSLYGGGRNHHLTSVLYNDAMSWPFVQEDEFTSTCHDILQCSKQQVSISNAESRCGVLL